MSKGNQSPLQNGRQHSQGVVQGRRISQLCGLERLEGRRIIVPRRSNSAPSSSSAVAPLGNPAKSLSDDDPGIDAVSRFAAVAQTAPTSATRLIAYLSSSRRRLPMRPCQPLRHAGLSSDLVTPQERQVPYSVRSLPSWGSRDRDSRTGNGQSDAGEQKFLGSHRGCPRVDSVAMYQNENHRSLCQQP